MPSFSNLRGIPTIAVVFIALIFSFAASGQAPGPEQEAIEIYSRYRTAIGGEENLAKILSAEIIVETDLMGSTRTERRIEDRVNRRWYSVSEGGVEGKQENGFDGSRQWSRSNFFRGYRDESPMPSGEPKRVRLQNETLDGKQMIVLQETMPERSGSTKLYFDPETFLLMARKVKMERGGNIIEQIINFSDYKKIDGVLIAMTENVETGTVKLTRRKVSVKHNIDLEPSIFYFEQRDSDKEDKSDKESIVSDAKVRHSTNPTNTALTDDVRKSTFNTVWSKINDTYFDPSFNGVDWSGVKAKYEPELAKAKSDQELNDLLNRMIGELGKSHLRIIPPDQLVLNGVGPSNVRRGGVGIELRYLDGEIVVSDIRQGSPAAEAGLKRGDVIMSVDGVAIQTIANEVRQKGGFQLREEIAVPRAIHARLAGEVDRKVKVQIKNKAGKVRTVELARLEGQSSQELDLEFRKINNSVGYIRFNIFIGDLPAMFSGALETMKDMPALIIDLRGNPGGIGNHTTAIAGMLDKRSGSLGVSRARYGKQSFDYSGSERSYSEKIIFLVDEMTGSSAEVLAAGLQANGRAKVVGTRTAGAVLPSIVELLPNGSALQFPVADFSTIGGKILEGRGISPDIEVKLTKDALANDRDLALEAAVMVASTQSKQT